MTNKIKQPTPRVHLQAYFRLQKLTAAIQRGRFPNKQDLARLTERTPRTVQRDLRELVNTFSRLTARKTASTSLTPNGVCRRSSLPKAS